MESLEDCLNILGLSQGASWDEVNEAYRDLVRVWHPDRFQGDERLLKKASDQTVLLNSAIKTLRGAYKPAAKTRPNQKNTPSPERPPVTAKPIFRTNFEAADRVERTRAFELPPLLVYQRPSTSLFRIALSLIAGALGYISVHNAPNSAQTVFGCVLSLLAVSSAVRNTCLVFIRRPLIRVDALGLASMEVGLLSWTELSKVWTLMQASSPCLAIECNDTYLQTQPWIRRLGMRFRHWFRRAHLIVTCAGLDAHPNDVVRAINAQHLTGDLKFQDSAPAKESPAVAWCRLVSVLSAIAVIVRCVLDHELTAVDFGFYFLVFAVCQGYEISVRLLRVPVQA
jgi:hypothetical protein